MDEKMRERMRRRCMKDCYKCGTTNINYDVLDFDRPHALNLYHCRNCGLKYTSSRFFKNTDTKRCDDTCDIYLVKSISSGKEYKAAMISKDKMLIKIEGRYHQIDISKINILRKL